MHSGYADDDGYSSNVYEEKASDVQDYMQELLKDLSLFRRKIGDDKGRFLGPDDGEGQAETEAWRQPLGALVNV